MEETFTGPWPRLSPRCDGDNDEDGVGDDDDGRGDEGEDEHH